MSSHHFVKEGQEPALFIVDAVSLDQVEPLLEWAPLVAVSDHSLDEVLRWGIKIDTVFCPPDKMTENRSKVMDQEPVQLVLSENDLLREGILFLIDMNQKAVNLVVNVTDNHFELAKNFPALQIALINRNVKWTFHSAGNYTKWLPVKSKLYLRRNSSEQSFAFQGLHESDPGLEALADGMVSIQSGDVFWIGEHL